MVYPRLHINQAAAFISPRLPISCESYFSAGFEIWKTLNAGRYLEASYESAPRSYCRIQRSQAF